MTATNDGIINLKGVIKDNQLVALLDHNGKDIGTPITGRMNEVTGGMAIYGTDGTAALEIQKSGYENKITAINYYPYLAFCENSTYRFGKKDGADGIVLRVALAGGAETNGVNVTALYVEDGTTLITSGSIINVWAWDDYQLAQVLDLTTGKYHLYKSIDNFSTCGANAPLYNDNKIVFACGWNVAKSAVAASVSVMAQWSLCRGVNRRGEDLVIFGQYNVNGARVAGSTNDWSNVLCSRQAGDAGTWDVVVEANTGGTNFLRHCHAVMQDPYTKEFYFFYGDSNTSGAYVWDGVLPLPANTPPSQASQYRGWRGVDRYNNPAGDYNALQITSAVFLPDEIIVPIDHGFTAARGVYSLSRDLTRYEKIWDGASNGLPINHSMYNCVLDPISKAIVASTIIETVGTDQNADYTLWIYTATKAGKYRDWKRVARYMLDTTATTGRSHSVFSVKPNGDIWMGSAKGAGKNYVSTAICRVAGVYDAEYEEPVHPVYWVDPVFGNDANTGHSPVLAWKTLNYALRVSRVTLSALVNVMQGITDESTSSYAVTLNTTSKQAQLNYPAIVRGRGRRLSGFKGNTVSGVFSQGGTPVNIRFESLSGYNLAAGSIFDHGASTPLTKTAEFVDFYFSTVGAGVGVRQASGRTIIREFDADLTANAQLVRCEFATDSDVTIQSGVVRGGKYIVGYQAGAASVCKIEQVTGIGQTACGVDVQAAGIILPDVKNCAFDTSVAGVRDNRSAKTSANGIVDYNVYKTANSTLVGGDQNSKTTSDLQLIGTTGMPKPTSPVIGAGTNNVSAMTDGVGDAFVSPRNVGAF